jgi:DNA-binding transcriptional regulator GbsR (MarR family)
LTNTVPGADFIQVDLARKKEEGVRKLQARSRGVLGRKKAKFVKDLRRKERQEQEWVESYQKLSHKKIDLHVDSANATAPSPQRSPARSPTKPTNAASKKQRSTPPGAARDHFSEPDAVSTPVMDPALARQSEEVMERLHKLEEMERHLQEKADKMDEIERAAKAREEAMDRALKQLEEQTKKAEADRLAQQQLLMMAAGPMSHRSDYGDQYSTQQRRMMGTGGRMPPQSSRRSMPNSSRVPDAPPTARSARGGAGIPPDAPRMTYNGEEWVQLWDPDESAWYWYCERTQVAQWDAPGPQRGMNSGPAAHNATMPLASSRRSMPNSARVPEAPPTARSARGGAGIPPDAPRMTYNGDEWVQLWDSDEAAYYWYCEHTQFAQWDAPGVANNQSSATMVASYLNQISEGEDSGYESAGAMTDYSTDHYDEHSMYTDDSGYDNTLWHEYWDESAQAKYWYNEITVSLYSTTLEHFLPHSNTCFVSSNRRIHRVRRPGPNRYPQ